MPSLNVSFSLAPYELSDLQALNVPHEVPRTPGPKVSSLAQSHGEE